MFAQTELDAHLWHTFIQNFQPDKLGEEAKEQDLRLWRRGGSALDKHLESNTYVLGDNFTAADCVVGWSVNWGRRMGALDGGMFPRIEAYVARLLERPLCPLAKD